MVLTLSVLRYPLHPGRKISNLEVVSIKYPALLQPEVHSLMTILCLAGFISQPFSSTVKTTISWIRAVTVTD
jgi:hypothetical protein